MNMIEVKTAELSGAALDWAVGIAEGIPLQIPVRDVVWSQYCEVYSPSVRWDFCGPLIEYYQICFAAYPNSYFATLAHNDHCGSAMGGTHLIAACRAIVAAKLGDTVQIPAELLP